MTLGSYLARVAGLLCGVAARGRALRACPECEGRRSVTRYVGDSDRDVPCAACSGSGRRAPRVTA